MSKGLHIIPRRDDTGFDHCARFQADSGISQRFSAKRSYGNRFNGAVMACFVLSAVSSRNITYEPSFVGKTG